VSFAHISCPTCNPGLRIAASTPASALIRCPKCRARFRRPEAAEDSDRGITTAAAKTARRAPATVPEDEAELLRKIRRPILGSRTRLWVVLGSLAAGRVLLGGGVGYWLTRTSAPPPAPAAANVVPPAAAGVRPGRFVPPGQAPAAVAGTPIEWFEKGNRCMQRGDNPGAIDAYTRAIALRPNFPEAYCNRGMPNLYVGAFDASIADATKAIELNLNDNDRQTEARTCVGVVLWLSGAAAKAREHLEWVRDHGNRDFVEYDLAVLLLHRLDRGVARKAQARNGSEGFRGSGKSGSGGRGDPGPGPEAWCRRRSA
jgi:tetratricopeptide (TPR) repeat protein